MDRLRRSSFLFEYNRAYDKYDFNHRAYDKYNFNHRAYDKYDLDNRAYDKYDFERIYLFNLLVLNRSGEKGRKKLQFDNYFGRLWVLVLFLKYICGNI